MLPQYYGLHKKTLWYIHISHRVEPACFSRGFKSFLVLFPILLSVYTQYIWKIYPFSLPFILEARSVWFCVRDAQTWRLLGTNTISWWKESPSPLLLCVLWCTTSRHPSRVKMERDFPLSPKIPHGSLALGSLFQSTLHKQKTGRISPFSR